jgi:hypothetical protein
VDAWLTGHPSPGTSGPLPAFFAAKRRLSKLAKRARSVSVRQSYVVIGTSAGGVAALSRIFKELPADFLRGGDDRLTSSRGSTSKSAT